MEEEKIILVGKHITENEDEIAEGYIQVELVIEDTLNEIGYQYLRKYAKNTLDLIDEDDLEDVDEDNLVDELNNRDYDFIGGADNEKLINKLEGDGYKVIYEYDKEYYEYLQISDLDVQDMHMLKEITKKFMNASIFEKADMYKAMNNHQQLLSLEQKLDSIKKQL